MDNLLEKFLSHNFRVVRLGSPEKVRSDLFNATIEARLEKTGVFRQIEYLKKTKAKNLNTKIQELKEKALNNIIYVFSVPYTYFNHH